LFSIICLINIRDVDKCSKNINIRDADECSKNISSSQWNLFIESGIIFTEDSENIFIGQYNAAGGDRFYYSIL